MRILITGAAGFIGSHLAERLARDGHAVWGIDNLETGRVENSSEFYLAQGGLEERAAFYDYANEARPELVIHCAASYSDPNKWHRDVDTNISGTINAINVAKYHDAKLVYFQTALPPVSSYAISKIAGQRYIELSDVPYLIFRLSNIYGPRNLSGPIPAFYKRLAAEEICTVVKTERDMVYIDDLVQCVMLALEHEEEGTYDVCSGSPVQILELWRQVAAHFPDVSPPWVTAPSADDVKPETSAFDGFGGWRPTTSLREGVTNAVDWYDEHGVGDTYTHLKVGT